MKYKAIVSILALSSIPFYSAIAKAAINEPNNTQITQPSQPQTTSTQTNGTTSDTAQVKSPIAARILSDIIAINKNEINTANLALSKNISPAVKDYAQTLLSDHQKNLDKMLTISKDLNITPTETKISTLIEQKGKKEVNFLQGKDGVQFEKAYVKAMVKGHREALTMIDKALIKVQNPELKQQLQSTRTTVEHHLKAGEKLESQIKPN